MLQRSPYRQRELPGWESAAYDCWWLACARLFHQPTGLHTSRLADSWLIGTAAPTMPRSCPTLDQSSSARQRSIVSDLPEPCCPYSPHCSAIAQTCTDDSSRHRSVLRGSVQHRMGFSCQTDNTTTGKSFAIGSGAPSRVAYRCRRRRRCLL